MTLVDSFQLRIFCDSKIWEFGLHLEGQGASVTLGRAVFIFDVSVLEELCDFSLAIQKSHLYH